MKLQTRILGIGAALAAASFVVTAVDAQAGGRPGNRKRHHFRSQPAPAHAKTPAVGADGTTDSTSRAPVAGAALEGGFRQDIVNSGALLAMSSSRALVLNSYRGLTLVDTSDPSAPRVLASVAVDGTGERMFLGTDEVAVVSGAYDATGARTIVTSVVIGDASLSVAGKVEFGGSLSDASRVGDELLLVAGDGYYGPIVYMDAASATPGGGPTANGLPGRKSMNSATGGVMTPGMMPPWYGGGTKSHVARVRIGADGSPSLLGTLDLDGSVNADAISGTAAVLALLANDPSSSPDPTQGTPNGPLGWYAPRIQLVHVTDDASGAPTNAGTLSLDTVSGVAALDLAGSTLRALAYADSGEIVATFDVSGGAPIALGSVSLPDWPSAFAFSGGAFVYGTTQWNYEVTPPTDPVFDPNGVADMFGGKPMSGMGPNMMGAKGGPTAAGVPGPTSALHVIDLSDPASPVAGGSLDLGGGWLSTFVAVPGGVVGTLYGYDDQDGSTTLFRVDLADLAAPSRTGTATLPSYANLGRVLGDLLLVNGGKSDANGSFIPSTQLVDISAGGLVPGGSFAAGSWTTDAARDANVLGLAAYDRLTLVDVSNAADPTVKGEVRFIVNVAGFAALDATTGAALTTDYLGGDVEIRTVRLPAADALAPLDVLKVATGDAQMFASAPFLYVVATDWTTGRASVTVVDATDPSHLTLRGSLDLASYPGQVFFKDKALLLLRESDSLFVTNAKGKRKAARDAFGRGAKSWLRDSLSAVLDVVDLANPDTPIAAERLRLRWDFSGQAILSGDSLFVASYVDLTGPDDSTGEYSYQIREIDVTDPLKPVAGAAVEVPGTLAAVAGAPHQVLTTDYTWDETTGTTTSTLNLVDLSLAWQDRVLASRPLDGWAETVTVGGGFAYVVTENWDGSKQGARLSTFAVSGLVAANAQDRERGAYAGDVRGGCLLLRTWGWTGSMDVYSLAAPGVPAFIASHDVAGLSGDVTVLGGRAYVAGGLYGVESFDLSK
jgi:hypothetical protein